MGLEGTRQDGLACQEFQNFPVPAFAICQGSWTHTTAGMRPKGLLDRSVFQGMKANDYYPTARLKKIDSHLEGHSQTAEFVVYENSQGLKGLGGGVDAPGSPGRHDFGYQFCEPQRAM